MTFQAERLAIETYLRNTLVAVPMGFDGHPFTPMNNTVRITIKSGAAMQGSIGRALNVIEHIGTVTATIYTEGGKGSAAWRGIADALANVFFEKSINQARAIAGSDVFVRFSPPQLGDNRHPYIAADFADAPFHITNLVAPFVRYGLR